MLVPNMSSHFCVSPHELQLIRQANSRPRDLRIPRLWQDDAGVLLAEGGPGEGCAHRRRL